jgi:hypothetical protein
MSITFGQAAALLCVATTIGGILYEPIIKPVREAIKEFNQNRRSKIKPAEPNPASKTPPNQTPLRLVK